jgi:hypothetical protein
MDATMDVSSYRPISILTSFSKILEKVTYNRLLEHVFNKNILNLEKSNNRKCKL